MSALDSLVGLLELRKADGLILTAGEPPALLGGRDYALTMPALDEATLTSFLDELLSADQRAALASGQAQETEFKSARAGAFLVKARKEGSRIKLVIRRGTLRQGASAAPVAPPTTSLAPSPAPAPEKPSTPLAAPPAPVTPAPTPPPFEGLGLLGPLLDRAVEARASDLIVASGSVPVLKVRGAISRVPGVILDEADLHAALAHAMGTEKRRRLDESGSVDFALSHSVADRSRPVRFRGNAFRHAGGLTGVFRPIWDVVPTLEELRLPRTLRKVVESPNGLVLFAGPTGSGKSTTLAALMELVNQARPCHVLTLEDPIEYQFPPGTALVHQREVGVHVRSFAEGLRAALRESPDVILVGEMRDPETVELALTAAETGHLVLSTIHAGSAAGAIERVVNALPEVDRASLRVQLASVLRHVVVQHLLPATDGGRVPAVGFLCVNHAVSALVREGRTQLLATQMEIGAEEGMVTLEAALAELVKTGRITKETALGATLQRESVEAALAERGRK